MVVLDLYLSLCLAYLKKKKTLKNIMCAWGSLLISFLIRGNMNCVKMVISLNDDTWIYSVLYN